MCELGLGLPADHVRAVAWYRAAIPYDWAWDDLGYMHRHGLGVPRDYGQALRWYRAGDAHNETDSSDALYLNREATVAWYQRVAEGGPWREWASQWDNGKRLSIVACFGLGLIHEVGYGVEPDAAEAARWYRRAAERGDENALYALGDLARHGRGVPHNPVEALAWLLLAVEHAHRWHWVNVGIGAMKRVHHPHPRAVLARDRLLATLAPEQVADARRRAGEFAARMH
jgi:TPR repeat protein